MASTKAATIRGVFLKPGLSKNRRLYTRANIAKAVERMKSALDSGEGMPLNMATSHAAAFQDDATSTVGRITDVKLLSDGSAQFEAEIANTAHGRDVANLAAGKFIKGVSIRGEWRGEPYAITHTDGNEAMTADDLAIHGIDFTNSPGVDGAEIQYAVLSESHNRLSIFESVDAVEVISRDEELVATEAADVIRDAVETAVENAVNSIFEKDESKPSGNVSYADPGYQKDKQKRFPIENASNVRAAWSHINESENASSYTAAQLARVKSRIKSAAKKFNINVVDEAELLASDIHEILEAYASISLVNDYDTINITGQTNDPHKLRIVANRIAFGAIAAMHAIDPDDDGDIYLSKPDWSAVDATGDAGGMGPEEEVIMNDNNMECSECGAAAMENAIHCHMCGAQLPVSMTANALGCGNCGETTPQDAMYCPTCGDPVPQAESTDNAPIQNKENEEMSDENATVADETPAEETAVESTTARTLSDADLQALAALIMGAKATENTEEEVAVEVTPEAEVAAEEPAVDAEEVVEEPAAEAEESHESKEISVSENKMFSAEEVAAMVAEAAQSAATAAVEKATSNAIESYRTGRVFRKGLSASAVGTDASDLSEAELTPEALAEMNSSNFRKVQSETWGSHPFFAAKFAQAERGF